MWLNHGSGTKFVVNHLEWYIWKSLLISTILLLNNVILILGCNSEYFKQRKRTTKQNITMMTMWENDLGYQNSWPQFKFKPKGGMYIYIYILRSRTRTQLKRFYGDVSFLRQKLSTLISFGGFIGDEPLQNVGSTDLPSEIRALYKLEESARMLFNETIPTAGFASISMVILWIFGLVLISPSLCP